MILAGKIFDVMFMQAKLGAARHGAYRIAAGAPGLAAIPKITVLMRTDLLTAGYGTQLMAWLRIDLIAASMTTVGKGRCSHYTKHQ